MAPFQAPTKRLNVFISYAWEEIPKDFTKMVWELACHLQEVGGDQIQVVIDKLYAYRPPEEGWITWMHNNIEDADIVLIVCSPLYLERFNKRQKNPDEGKGVSYEGAIINMELYDAQQKNSKFYPILPDGGNHQHVPKVLKSWYNGHTFPAKYEAIFKMVIGENPKFEKSQASIQEEIETHKEEIQKIEVEIVKEINTNKNEQAEVMQNSIQVLVQAFLKLNTLEKIRIAKILQMNIADAQKLRINELDKEIFKFVKEKNLLHQLWDEINKVIPFETSKNPF